MKNPLKEYFLKYAKLYAERLKKSDNYIDILKKFDYDFAFLNIQDAILEKESLRGELALDLMQENTKDEAVYVLKRAIPANILAMSRNDMDENLAYNFINDKGSDFYDETRGLEQNQIKPIYDREYLCSKKQLLYIETFNVIIHNSDELTGREADQILKSLKTKTRTKPYYFDYYIKQKK